MIIISDSSPLIRLAAIGQLRLLENLFHEIVIPKKVYEEIVVMGKGKTGWREVQESNWIRVVECHDKKAVLNLLSYLDEGEAEAIILALELKSELLIMDEEKGRSKAKELGIVVTGLIGILIRAKKAGLINNVMPIVEELQKNKYWIHKSIIEKLKRDLNE